MKRILFSSLLTACVLALPRDDNDYNDIGKNAVDNCSLAATLYFPLRRSESFIKGLRDDIIESANSGANDIERRIQRETERDRDFRFWSSFRYSREAEASYKETIAAGSRNYLTVTDIFHSYISGGEFPLFPNRPWRYRTLFGIPNAEESLDEFVSNLTENREKYQNLMKRWLRLIKPDTWPYLASCLYEAFKENQDSSTISQVVTDLVSEDEFEWFNHYFERYVGDIARALEKALQSEETLKMVEVIYELTKTEIRSIDYNRLQPALYNFVLQLKTVLMKPDFEQLFFTLNRTEYFIQESAWKFNTGRWPEMESFVVNFLRRTIGSIVFWDRLTGPFITEIKNDLGFLYELRHNLADIKLEDVADTIFLEMTSIMDMIADGDETSIRRLFQDIRASKWDEAGTYFIRLIASKLTSCNLADLVKYIPSYQDIKTAIVNSPLDAAFQSIKNLLFKDWPQDEIYPASIEDFVRRIYETRVPIFRAIFQTPCVYDKNI